MTMWILIASVAGALIQIPGFRTEGDCNKVAQQFREKLQAQTVQCILLPPLGPEMPTPPPLPSPPAK
jgi:hypothetical protein